MSRDTPQRPGGAGAPRGPGGFRRRSRSRPCRYSSSTSSSRCPTSALLAIRSRSQWEASCLLRRKASLSSRLARLRSTAVPTLRLAAKPRRPSPRPFSTAMITKKRPSTRRPLRRTRRKSEAAWILSRGRRACLRCPTVDRQAPTRLRPFWRRLFRTRRPPLVLMRTRKPWVLFRLRLFGWKVRFMLAAPGPEGAPDGPPRFQTNSKATPLAGRLSIVARPAPTDALSPSRVSC